MQQEPQAITLYPSKMKWILLSLLGVALAAASALAIQSGKTGVGIAGLLLFGSMPIIGAVQLFTNLNYLSLDRDGFEYASLGRKHRFNWADVSDFAVFTIRQGLFVTNKMVVFNSKSIDQKRMARLSRLFSGRSGGLPDTYGMKAEALVDLMRRYQSNALKIQSPS